MWSFCIYDSKEKKLFCARDRLGIKPFYYFFDNEHFGFSSEIKQLLYLFGKQEENKTLVFDFLALSSYGNYNEDTYFENIKKLQPGSYLVVDLNNKIDLYKKKWWDLSSIPIQQNINDEEIVFSKIRSLLSDSIKIRLRSDVPCGTALSGGLDSSGIVCLIDKIMKGNKEKNKTFTVISDSSHIEDNFYSEIINRQIPTTPYLFNFSMGSNLEDLETLMWHQEEPIQSTSMFGSWYLYKFIKENNVTVNLDGQGADELMGGYYQPPFFKANIDLIKSNRYKDLLNNMNHISQLYKIPKFKILTNIVMGFLIIELKEFPQFYYSRRINSIKKFINSDFFSFGIENSGIVNKKLWSNFLNHYSLLKNDSYVITTSTNLPGILRIVDRNSMAFSVESRLPFLDYRLVEYLFSLPNDFMIRNGFTKFGYRESMKDVIPEPVRLRKSKEGFFMPEYEILKKNQKFVNKIFSENNKNEILNIELIKILFQKSINNPRRYNNIIFRALSYLIWKKVFFNETAKSIY